MKLKPLTLFSLILLVSILSAFMPQIKQAQAVGTLKFSTSFEDAVDNNTHFHIYDSITHAPFSLSGTGGTWVVTGSSTDGDRPNEKIFLDDGTYRADSPTPHSGAKMIGSECTDTTRLGAPDTTVKRAQIDYYIQDRGYITDTYFMRCYIYLSPTFALNQTWHYNWCSLDTYHNTAGGMATQTGIAIRTIHADPPFNMDTDYRIAIGGSGDYPVGGTWTIGHLSDDGKYRYVGYEDGFSLSNLVDSQWHKFEVYCKRGPESENYVTLWIDDVKLLEGSGLNALTYTDYVWFCNPPKMYYDGNDNIAKCMWVDDWELWDDMPSQEDVEAPAISNVAHNTTIEIMPCKFSAIWTDNVELSGAVFSKKEGAGAWTNDTWASLSGASAWANTTKTPLPAVGTIVYYRWFCNDTNDNWGTSSIYSFTTTALGTNIVVLLNFPSDNSTAHTKSVDFQYIIIFYQVPQNVSLWSNITGSWAKFFTSPVITNNTVRTITVGFSAATVQTVIWNIGVANTTHNVFGGSNRTLYVQVKPYYSDQNYSISVRTCTFTVIWYDGDGLSGYIFNNNVGGWHNTTWTAWAGSPNQALLSLTETMPVGNTLVSFIFYANDTDGNLVSSEITSFYTTEMDLSGGSSGSSSYGGTSQIVAALFPIVFGLTGVTMMILGPVVMVWKLKEDIFENINWLGYSLVIFIIGLGLFIYLLTS